MKEEGIERVVIAYDSEDTYSSSFKTATVANLENEGIKNQKNL